jgi:hypothetical protein
VGPLRVEREQHRACKRVEIHELRLYRARRSARAPAAAIDRISAARSV